MHVPVELDSASCQHSQRWKTAGRIWLWPNIVALDAPVVAVVWQRFVARAFAVHVPAIASVVLGLIVWGVYLLDRWLDARPHRPAEPAARHAFARRHRFAVGLAALVVFAAAVTLIPSLPIRYTQTGAVVAIVLAGYLVGVHAVGTPGLGELAKTFLVGLLFAAGIAVPLAAERPELAGAWLPAVGAFAATCWLNCRLIAGWESGQTDHPVGRLAAGGIAMGLCALSPLSVAMAVGAAVVILIGLHLGRARLAVPVRRVLADVAMLTPLAVAGLWA